MSTRRDPRGRDGGQGRRERGIRALLREGALCAGLSGRVESREGVEPCHDIRPTLLGSFGPLHLGPSWFSLDVFSIWCVRVPRA